MVSVSVNDSNSAAGELADKYHLKIRCSKSFRVLSYTLLQTLTQSPPLLSNKSRVKVRVRVRVREDACCSIHL